MLRLAFRVPDLQLRMSDFGCGISLTNVGLRLRSLAFVMLQASARSQDSSILCRV